MAPVDGVALSVATIAITSAMGAFYQMLPPISEVRKRNESDPGFAADVRVGEVAAASIALGIGAVASGLSGSPVPVVVAGITALGLVVLYESVLHSDRAFEGVTDSA